MPPRRLVSGDCGVGKDFAGFGALLTLHCESRQVVGLYARGPEARRRVQVSEGGLTVLAHMQLRPREARQESAM